MGGQVRARGGGATAQAKGRSRAAADEVDKADRTVVRDEAEEEKSNRSTQRSIAAAFIKYANDASHHLNQMSSPLGGGGRGSCGRMG